MDEDSTPDLAGATVCVEAGDPPIAGGRWFVLPGESYLPETEWREYKHKAMVPAHTLKSSPTWKVDPKT